MSISTVQDSPFLCSFLDGLRVDLMSPSKKSNQIQTHKLGHNDPMLSTFSLTRLVGDLVCFEEEAGGPLSKYFYINLPGRDN